jgi:immune inhibitor A
LLKSGGERKMKKLVSIVITFVLLTSIMFVAMPIKETHAPPTAQTDLHGVYTPNIELLIASAIRRGLLPAEPTDEQVTNYLQAYFAQKMIKPYEYSDPKMAERIAAREAGQDIGIDPEIDPVGDAKMIVLIVEFGGTVPPDPWMGPLHNKILQPLPPDNTKFWIRDFDTAHYQSMLFDATPGALSMRNYYLEQSYGVFWVEGTVFGWVKIDAHSEWWYGADGPVGIDNLNGPVYRIVADAIDAANTYLPGLIPWGDFDTDGDGFVDHFAIVHAGEGQEAGGGAQGDDAIWSHSWSAPPKEAAPGIFVSDYTIMPENGNLGVFCHEFAHDIGLPDEYDTIYSGEASTAFWTLMSSGSWLGYPGGPLDTMPSHISIWGKYALGWVSPALGNMERYKLADLPKTVSMEQVETTGGIKAVRVDLPLQVVYMNTPYSGDYEWWSGKADLADNKLTRTVDLTAYSGKTVTLTFWTQYEIEEGWDFGFVQVSTDGGKTWASLSDLEGRTTCDHDPDAMAEIVANLPGFTGSSNGWVHETFDLTSYAGKTIMLRFRYMTDWAVTHMGWFLDEITITAGDGTTVFYDDVETLDPGWTVEGWSRTTGTRKAGHYYIMEWRNFAGFDLSLSNCYNFPSYADYLAGYAERFSYNPGLLIWYRNFAYTDNWVGVHPGRGFLLVVDSHPAPLKTPIYGYTWRTRVQVQDATFSLQRTISNTLTYFGMTRTYPSLHGEPMFDDSRSYYNPAVNPIWVYSSTYPYNLFRWPIQADAGTIVPTYGLRITVTSQDKANTWANINFIMQK